MSSENTKIIFIFGRHGGFDLDFTQ